MGFDFENLYREEVFKTEFLPHEAVKKGKGLKLELNQDIVSLEFIEHTKSFVSDLATELQKANAAAAETGENEPAEGEAAEAGGKTLTNVLNDNLLVMDEIASTIRQFARILGGKPGENAPSDRVIRSWDLVRGGEPVPVSYEELVAWKFSLLKKLFNFCVYEAQSVQKKNGRRSGNS